jgi:PAS domain-containing protein
MNELISQIFLFVGGAGFTTIVNYFVTKRQQSREDFVTMMSLWKEDNVRLRHEEELLKEKVNELIEDINDLKLKLLLFETAHMELPIPMWVKDTDGTILTINRAYEKQFLEPLGKTASDYIGKTDFDIWPEEYAKKFQDNDVKALRGVVYLNEIIPINNKVIELVVIKYPRKINNTVIGIGGVSIDKSLLK